ncbi:hypothetical protein NIES4071_14560 [Calothrix sp. NIES-4071]|nr:hypothetical protein NIES4071_14560 [Calothrix sp. NIES-4071]BAZ55793.1 hypothetical protein NIES4105_14510 [Calothrix sp. NIES-4105]
MKSNLILSSLKLLVKILTQMAVGNSVNIVSTKKEITTQEAGDILQVSRPYFIVYYVTTFFGANRLRFLS